MSHFRRAALACLTGSVLAAGTAQARPVSYPEAWTLQTFNEAKRNAVLAHYTVDPRWAVGLRVEDRTYEDHVFVGPQANRLLKRWNAPDSQANLYLKLGVGAARGEFLGERSETRPAGFVQLAADWEDRRTFVSGSIGTTAVSGMWMREASARVGVAPYVAEFGALHTWLMVQADYRPDALESRGAETLTITPLVRLFKGPVLFEAGWSTNDEPLLNLTYRF